MARGKRKSAFGALKDEFEILGDITQPLPMCLQGWEVYMEPERTYDPVSYDSSVAAKLEERQTYGMTWARRISSLFVLMGLLAAPLAALGETIPVHGQTPVLQTICQMNRSARSDFLNSSKLSLNKTGEFKIKGIVYSDPATVDFMASFGFTIQSEDELQPKKRKMFHLIMGGGSLVLMGATLSADQPRNLGSDYMRLVLFGVLIGPAIYGTLSYLMPFDHRNYLAVRFNRHLDQLKKVKCS